MAIRSRFASLTCVAALLFTPGTLVAQSEFSGPDPLYSPSADEAVIYLNRQHMDQSYQDWVLHLWSDGCDGGWASQVTDTSQAPTNWPEGPTINGTGVDPVYGAYWVLRIQPDSTCGNWIIHDLQGGNQTNDVSMDLAATHRFARMAFVIANDNMRNAQISVGLPICVDNICEPVVPTARTIRDASAHWIDESTLLWNLNGAADQLFAAPHGGMSVDEQGQINGAELQADLIPTTLTEEQQALVPHLAHWQAYSVEGLNTDQIKRATLGQLWATGSEHNGQLVGTRIQTMRLLDDLYTRQEADADEASLGIQYANRNIEAKVWAPTAHNVTLKVFPFPVENPRRVQSVPMTLDPDTGIWSASEAKGRWNYRYYRFEVEVYDAGNDQVRTVSTTDPYSVNVSADGHFSQFVDLTDRSTMPPGWQRHQAPTLNTPENAVIYEGHVRDFSIRDESTFKPLRGKYLAFADRNSEPVRHLQALQAAGLTHFHVLPTADFSTTRESAGDRIELTSTVAELCASVPEAQVCGVESGQATLLSVLEQYDPTSNDSRNLMESLRQYDGFNWGYDPFHYNVPEGSYATRADGLRRIRELRAMNMALHRLGLRVVMDVVYNHTSSSGLDAYNSTFDKLVPGYYFRRDPVTGAIENASGAGSDTAGEARMFGKFIQDSVVHWARHYGYDDFRFDLMTFIPKKVIEDARAAVHEFKPDSYFYGEGWNMPGSSANDAIFERAEQFNMAGTGVGTFNDRMRDPMRFLALMKGENVDRIRAGLAGNLAAYNFYNSASERVSADTVGAYGQDPQESVNYVSKHDNETLWDMIQKQGAVASDMGGAERARIQNLTVAMPLFSQGIPFIHMGSDLLRSKSMDRNTYDAGDWYNYLDFTKESNNWAVGMPLDRGDSSEAWIRSQFSNPNTYVTSADIQLAASVFQEFLQITQQSALFALTDLNSVQSRIGFHNTGRDQVPGVIAMSLDDGIGLEDIDPSVDAMMVVFNGNTHAQSVTVVTAEGFELHPIQQASADVQVRGAGFSQTSNEEDGKVYGTFTVPALSVAVYVKPQLAAQGEGLSADATQPTGGASEKPYAHTPLLRGDMNGWGTDTAFLYNGDSTYTAFGNLEGGTEYQFKIASSDWATVNLGATSYEDAQVALGVEKVLAFSNDNLKFTPAKSEEFRFTLNAMDTQAPMLTVSSADPYSNPVYLKGSMNGWTDGLEIAYVGAGQYQLTTYLAAGSYEFKLADSGWSAPNLGLNTAGDALTPSASVLLANGSNDNINLVVDSAGDYTFTLDTANPVNPTLDMVPANRLPVAMYLKGSMNGWSNLDQFVNMGNNRYEIVVSLDAGGYELKIANDDWSVEFTADGRVQLDQPASFVAGAGRGNTLLQLPDAGTLRISVDANYAEPRVLFSIAP